MPQCSAWILFSTFSSLLLPTVAITAWPLEQRPPSKNFGAFEKLVHHRRTLLQSGGAKLAGGAVPLGTDEDGWEMYSASHFDAFKEVAGFSSDSSRSVHIILTNHMVAEGDDLAFSINGKPVEHIYMFRLMMF